MVNFRNHLYKKEIVLQNAEGVEETFMFNALGAKWMGKIFKVAQRFSDIKEDSTPNEILSRLDEETTSALVELVEETVKKSYNTLSESDVSDFAGAHFMELFPLVFELNLKADK